jgi:hypothetical protein
MPSITGSNIASHFPIGAGVGVQHTPPTVAGNLPVSYAVPAPAVITINGITTPKIDTRQHDLRNIVDFINGLAGAGVTASIDRYGRLMMSHPVGVVVGGDAATRLALGI